MTYAVGMDPRIDLTIDKRGRMSVGKLGLSPGHVVAEPLPDGSGWVFRPAAQGLDAEADIRSRPGNIAAIERSLDDLAVGQAQPRRKRAG